MEVEFYVDRQAARERAQEIANSIGRKVLVYRRRYDDDYRVEGRKEFFAHAPCNPAERHSEYTIWYEVSPKKAEKKRTNCPVCGGVVTVTPKGHLIG